ncbi:MAG: hypothetical protein DHS20C21_14460 [Gemmatimonadota bacterium]|nr:MAG: hypothetical protein DHS20C21_14460 [Gemmatimonadota bacterium]
MTSTQGSRAERAGRAAKTAQRRRRDREKVVGLATAALLGIPLLFAAVWCRMEVSSELRDRDDLLARQHTLQRSILELDGERTRLMTWSHLGEQAKKLGLREPTATDVMWVQIAHR